MYNKSKFHVLTIVLLLILFTLACTSVQVGIVTPTLDDIAISADDTQGATPEAIESAAEESGEDFSHLWVEYWNPVLGYGLALPSHWEVQTDGQGGYMSTRSYTDDFFRANSVKGEWVNGVAPDGAVKLDFVPFTGVLPEQSLGTAISNILGADADMTTVLSVDPVEIGNLDAVLVTTARVDNLENTASSIAIRLSPDTILLVAAYPDGRHELSDVKTMLNSLVLSKETPITKPRTAPQPAFIVDSAEIITPTLQPQMSNSNCDSGYMGSVDEVIEVLQYNIGIGNYAPLTYLIGDPFIFGFWQSEGLSMSRGEAHQELVNNYLPAPEEFVVYAEPSDFPSLNGIPLENMWGPEVDVAGSLYSTGWGPDGQDEAIIVVARCKEETYDTYYWYSVLIGHFD